MNKRRRQATLFGGVVKEDVKSKMRQRKTRNWHPAFEQYMDFIVNHPNYKGMPHPYKKDGSVRWVVAGRSEIGRERTQWWDKKRGELGIKKEGAWISKVARANHPTGEKPCQICGRIMKLDYVYPTKLAISQLNSIPGLTLQFRYEDFMPIEDIFDKLVEVLGEDAFNQMARVFKIPGNVQKSKKDYLNYMLENCKGKLSPGAMSNAPDRFDGFHTYNICCRSSQDLGRHYENLAIYGEDRRAYEHWCDGDWKATAWLMKKFSGVGKCVICGKMGPITADHIGPVSLGFSLRPKLRPACKRCNSARNYRMNFDDVQSLIKDEEKGEQVVSWHSKYIWDELKYLVKTDEDAKKLSHLMRRNMHHVLIILSDIAAKGFKDFLIRNFLHPEYAYYYIKFKGFDPSTGEYSKMIRIPGRKKQYENNAKRYIRIAFEALQKYQKKENRRVGLWKNRDVDLLVTSTLEQLQKGDEKSALTKIHSALQKLANDALKDFTSPYF